jgi:hypothetical protein
LAYDRGELEIMSPSAEHESVAYFVSLPVAVLAEAPSPAPLAGLAADKALQAPCRQAKPEGRSVPTNRRRRRADKPAKQACYQARSCSVAKRVAAAREPTPSLR